MNPLPEISPPEKVFIRNILSGCSESESYAIAWPHAANNISADELARVAKAHARKTHIKAWVKYLKDAKPEQMINDVYIAEIAFGKPAEQMRASEAYINSQFAGKEVAHIFLDTLRKIQAEIWVPCGKHIDKVAI